MPAPSKTWSSILDNQIDSDSPIDQTLLTQLRDNLIHLRDWLGGSFAAGAAMDHNHDGVNSALVGIPPGGVVAFGMSTAPSGWLKANGAAVSRTTYAALFAAIGTTFGVGDGTTTFNLPDLRAEFIRGLDDGRGVDSGRGLGTGQSSQMPNHSHSISETLYAAGGFGTGQPATIVGGQNTSASPASLGSAGGSSNGGESRPRNVALLFCIKF